MDNEITMRDEAEIRTPDSPELRAQREKRTRENILGIKFEIDKLIQYTEIMSLWCGRVSELLSEISRDIEANEMNRRNLTPEEADELLEEGELADARREAHEVEMAMQQARESDDEWDCENDRPDRGGMLL